MQKEAIRAFWDDRARRYETAPQATTADVFIRQVEIDALAQVISRCARTRPLNTVADVGCGNGYATIELAKRFPAIAFTGYDFSSGMIVHAQRAAAGARVGNVSFEERDITKGPLPVRYDLVYTDRCLTNVPGESTQYEAIGHLAGSVALRGVYVMIENFLDGQEAFNALRRAFGLGEIAVNPYNFFFDRVRLEPVLRTHFTLEPYVNISSQYYLVSRVIYSALCQRQGVEPSYLDAHHELAARLPYAGNFGPTGMYVCANEQAG